MTEFTIKGSPTDRWFAVTSVVRGYLSAALFADLEEGWDADYENISDEMFDDAERECASFVDKCGLMHDRATAILGYDDFSFGCDFWFSRNGHGVGFWDREALKETYGNMSKTLGDNLHDIAKTYEVVDVYIGGDGKFYFM